MERFEVAFLVSLGLTFLAIPIILKILRRLGSIDHPNERSSHVVPTPRGAGFAQAVGGGAALASSGGLPLSGLVALAGFGPLVPSMISGPNRHSYVSLFSWVSRLLLSHSLCHPGIPLSGQFLSSPLSPLSRLSVW